MTESRPPAHLARLLPNAGGFGRGGRAALGRGISTFAAVMEKLLGAIVTTRTWRTAAKVARKYGR